jgi:hypothetical protein
VTNGPNHARTVAFVMGVRTSALIVQMWCQE